MPDAIVERAELILAIVQYRAVEHVPPDDDGQAHLDAIGRVVTALDAYRDALLAPPPSPQGDGAGV